MKKRKYEVTIHMTSEKQIGVWAESEEAAEEKAVEIVMNWNSVIDAEAMCVNEE